MDIKLDEKHVTGVLWQDFQHSQLIELFREAAQVHEKKTDKDQYRRMIDSLAMYVAHHFVLEEHYMRKYQFPDADAHTEEHQNFIRKLDAFRSDKNGCIDEDSENTLPRIGEWMLNHILGVDQELSRYILNYEKDHPQGKRM